MSEQQDDLIRRAYRALAYCDTSIKYNHKLLNDLEDYINSTGEDK